MWQFAARAGLPNHIEYEVWRTPASAINFRSIHHEFWWLWRGFRQIWLNIDLFHVTTIS
jgi:hypothetical protein